MYIKGCSRKAAQSMRYVVPVASMLIQRGGTLDQFLFCGPSTSGSFLYLYISRDLKERVPHVKLPSVHPYAGGQHFQRDGIWGQCVVWAEIPRGPV